MVSASESDMSTRVPVVGNGSDAALGYLGNESKEFDTDVAGRVFCEEYMLEEPSEPSEDAPLAPPAPVTSLRFSFFAGWRSSCTS